MADGNKRNRTVAVAAEPSPGLLVSMCMREDHGFFGGTPQPDGTLRMWIDDDERRKRVRDMRAFHAIATASFGEGAGDGTVRIPRTPPAPARRLLARLVHSETAVSQVWEELAGLGFWNPRSEAGYAAHMPPEAPPEGDVEAPGPEP